MTRSNTMTEEEARRACHLSGQMTAAQAVAFVEAGEMGVEPEDTSTRCEICGGNGWRAQRNPRLGPGVYEVRCDDCNGFGWVDGPEDSRP